MKIFVLAVAAAVALASIGEAWSQKFPTKPIRILVPFTAGSQADLFARIVSLSDVKERMQLQGAVIKTTTPEEFTQLIRADVATLSKVAKAANIRID